MATDAEARAQAKAIMDSCVGLAAEGSTLSAYDDAIISSGADLADAQKRRDMEKASACLLLTLEIMDRIGVRSPLLSEPYVFSKAEVDVLDIARACAALRGPTYVPLVGDCVIIGNPTHAFWVSAIDGSTYTTVNGGERMPDGAECIKAIERVYVTGAKGPAFGTRPVLRVIDCVSLAKQAATW